MPKLVKYFLTGSINSFVDFDLDYPMSGISLTGSEVIYTGSSGVETVYLAPRVSFDFTKASGATDRLYLNARLSDYNLSFAGTTLLLTEKASSAVVKIAAGSSTTISDQIVFQDGMANSKLLFDAVKNNTALPALDTLVQTPASKASLYAALPAQSPITIKAFAATNEGSTFATAPKPGVAMVLTGGSGVDVVYVAAYSNVDATRLSGSVDEVYLTGKFADYTHSVVGTTLTLTRSNGTDTETVKVAGGSSSTIYDRLIFADGFVKSFDLFTATKNNTIKPAVDSSIRTPGLQPVLNSSDLDDVTNLDVRSNIVLEFSEAVTAVAGKSIRIVNDANGGTKLGLYGESTVNSFTLDVTDPQVSISGARVTINLARDLDFSNNYHVEIDAGAFRGLTSQQLTAAVSDVTTLNFSTVTPDADKSISTTTGLSRIMQADGSLMDSLVWKDIEGWPGGKTGSQNTLDLSSVKVALVTADMLVAPVQYDSGINNVETGNFNLALQNFGADDLIYMDDLGRNNEDGALTTELVFAIQATSDGINTNLNFDPATGKDGGNLDILGQDFATVGDWQRVLNGSTSPFVYGSSTTNASQGAVNNPPTGGVTISGAPSQNQTLTASNTLADTDALGTITYQWLADGQAINGATGSSFTLTQAQVGKAISVRASYTDLRGSAEAVTSGATVAVANVNDAPTGAVTISGTAIQGQTLTAANTLADVDGMGTVTYQWLADGVAINGATASTFTLGQAQVGKAISVRASYTDGQNTAEAVTSGATALVMSSDVASGVLNLGTEQGINLNLIAPYTTQGGKVYYLLDRTGDGVSNIADELGHDVLDTIFNNGSDTFDTQASGAVAGVDDARTLIKSGYTVVLPTTTEFIALRTELGNQFPVGWQPVDYDSPNFGTATRVGTNVHHNVSFKGTTTYTNLYDGYYKGMILLQVIGSNSAPVLGAPTALSYTDTAGNDTFASVTGNLLGTDADNDSLSYGVSGGTLLNGVSSRQGTYGTLSVNTSTGAYTFVPNDAAIEGIKLSTSETFTVTVSDGKATTNANLVVNLTGANDAPTAGNALEAQTVVQGAALNYQFSLNSFSDVDAGDTLTYTASKADGSALPSWLSFNSATRTFSGTPASGDIGSLAVKVTAADSGNLQASSTFNISVADGGQVQGGQYTVVNTHVQPLYHVSPLIQMVPLTVSASGVTFGIQIGSSVAPFNSMTLDLGFDGRSFREDLSQSQIMGNWSFSDIGLAQDVANTLTYGALTLGTAFNPAQTTNLATSTFTWNLSPGNYWSADFSLSAVLENDQGTVLDVQQDYEFHYAVGLATATGTAGNDRFITYGGDVTVTGGAGSDRFVLKSIFGLMTITDFESGIDQIDMGLLLNGAGYVSASTVPVSTAQNGVMSPWSGQTLPTLAQILANDTTLDNKYWFNYDGSSGQLDLFGDRSPNVADVEVVHFQIRLANLPGSLTAADLLWSPYSSAVL